MTRIEQAVRQSLADLIPEDLGVDLVSAGAVKEIVESDTTLRLVVRLGYPCQSRLPALRVVTLGGEKVPQQLVERWAEAVRLVNVYGTTEGTVYQTSHTYSSAASALSPMIESPSATPMPSQ